MRASVLLLAVGCASLPDVGPFVDGTVELRSAIVAGGTAVVEELRRADASAQADTLQKAWAARVAAADAMVAYADALAAVVEAGKTGAERAGRLADSIRGLAGAVGVTIPAAPAAVATDAVKLIAKHVAAVRASRTLEEVLLATQPAVDAIGPLLRKDSKDLSEALLLANTEVRSEIRLANKDRTRFRDQLVAARDELYKKDPTKLTDVEKKQLTGYAGLLDATSAWYDPMQERLATAKARQRAGQELIAAADRATARWTAAHAQMITAVRFGRRVNARGLLQAAVEIRDLVERIRDL